MNNSNGIDFNDLLTLQALSGNETDDHESYSAEEDDDDDSFVWFSEEDDDDDDDDSFVGLSEEDDDDDDDDSLDTYSGESGDMADRRYRSRRRPRIFSKRRRYRGRRMRRAKPIHGTRITTIRSPSGQKMRVRLGKRFASSIEVNKLIKDVDKKFTIALKERKANHSRLSRQIVSNSKALNSKISRVNKTINKLQQQAQTSALMGMIQGSPKIETITLNPNQAGDNLALGKAFKADVKFKKQDMLLPLLMSGGLGGSGGDSNNDMMMLALLMNKD